MHGLPCDTPSARGMVASVAHLVEWEVVAEEEDEDVPQMSPAPVDDEEGVKMGPQREEDGARVRQVLCGVGGGRIDDALEELAEEAAAVGGVFAHSPKIRIAPAISSAMSG